MVFPFEHGFVWLQVECCCVHFISDCKYVSFCIGLKLLKLSVIVHGTLNWSLTFMIKIVPPLSALVMKIVSDFIFSFVHLYHRRTSGDIGYSDSDGKILILVWSWSIILKIPQIKFSCWYKSNAFCTRWDFFSWHIYGDVSFSNCL